MFAKSILTVAFMAGAALAQSSTAAGTSATISTSAIAAEVSASLKASWCNGQQNACKVLCDNSFETNSCDPTTLNWACTCNNGSTPGLQYYTTSIDAFTCQQAYTDCVAANPNDQQGQDDCTSNIEDHCGTLDVTNYTAAATTSTTMATSTKASSTSGGAASSTGSATTTSATAASTSNSAAMAIALGEDMGFGLIGAGLFAVFGFLL